MGGDHLLRPTTSISGLSFTAGTSVEGQAKPVQGWQGPPSMATARISPFMVAMDFSFSGIVWTGSDGGGEGGRIRHLISRNTMVTTYWL
jgi:hypothetical protein